MARARGELLPTMFEQMVVWTDESLAPFVHDAFAVPFVVIEGARRTIEVVDRVLAREFWAVRIRSLDDLGRRLWEVDPRSRSLPPVFLHANSRLHGTRPSVHGFQVPTLGRLLLSVLHFPALLPDAALRIMEARTVKLRDGLDAASSKRAAMRLGAFLAWTHMRYPSHPLRPQLEQLIPPGVIGW